MQEPETNASLENTYQRDVAWLISFLMNRGEFYVSAYQGVSDWIPDTFYHSFATPKAKGDNPYETFLREVSHENEKKHSHRLCHLLAIAERTALILTLAPYLSPEITRILNRLEVQTEHNLNSVQGLQLKSFLPCPETLLYLLAGNNIRLRMQFQQIFAPDHLFQRKRVLEIQDVPPGVPWLRGAMGLSPEYQHLFTFGQEYEPEQSPSFPAHKLSTDQTWDDLVVPYNTHVKIEELLDWIKYFEQMAAHPEFTRERKGYRCLLVGEPGTGKTMLGRLLSKETDRPVYRLSLDKIVSKYVGETTKNIARVFNTARNRNWILFCDEGDALFSKRSTNVQNAQDTYVNQDIAYLLQEIEDYPGIIIVATNFSSNMDKAFQRRFDTRIDFQKPEQSDIIRLWQKALQAFELSPDIDLKFVAGAQANDITGAQIIKVKHYLGLKALKHKNWELSLEDFCAGLRQVGLKVPDFEGYQKRKNQFDQFR
ncbi:MAG: ATP-binding protein [Microscillaceae bacterium]|nr:ATP-binding protein [Microscillaceae bacterium]